ncbi:MAG: DMT family transporter [Peptococcaceae bacterium]|nr:DMT family transporter [Peptococcaceae bacterium]
MNKIIYVILMVLSGWAFGIQSSINSSLGKRIGVYESSFFSFALGTAALLLVVLFFGKGNLPGIMQVPKWQLIGGLLGAFIVTSMVSAVPNIGAASAVFAIMLGQIMISMIIDHFGLFNVPVIHFNLYRLVGVVLMIAGLLFIFKGNLTS